MNRLEMDSPTLASPHSSSERKVDDAAPTAQRSNSVFLDKRPYRTGCNYTSTLRSGRWMRPGDFVRDKVQSRGVLVLGLLCILLFIALVTISDSSFLFPKNFHAYGAPDPTKSDLHCVLPTDTNSTSDLLNLASLIFDLVSAPDAALSIQKCTTLWAVFGYAVNDTSVITFIEPAPVYRVVDSSFRGVPGVSVTAVVTVANRSLSSFVNPLPFTGQSSSGGYVNFDGIYANDTTGSPYGTVARVQFSCGSPSTCGTGELLGVSFSMNLFQRAQYQLSVVSAPVPAVVFSGQTFSLQLQLKHLLVTPVADAPVVMNWYQLSDNVTLDPMPQVAFTDSNGIASFNLTVLSANNGSNLALEFTSVAALSASWSYTVMSTVTQLIAKAPPTDVYLAGQNATATVASGFTFSDANSLFTMLPRHSFVPDVIICTLPAVEHVQVTATATALSGSNFLQPGSLNGYTDVSFFETALDMVAPTLSNDVTLYSITAASGCATFPAFKFYDGSNGIYALRWTVDDVSVYTGPHVLVSQAVPDFTPMAFILGAGPMVSLWIVLSLVFGLLLCFGNKHHGVIANLLAVVLLFLWVVGIATFTFQQDGIFVSTTALQSANYVTSCCDFAQQSFTSSFMSLALFLLSLALLLLFFILLVRSLRDFNAKCVASKATSESAVKSDAAATVEPSVDARLAEAEAEELADMIGSHRMVRSESMDSLGTVAPRSKRMQIRYRLRKLGEAIWILARDLWFLVSHSAYFSRVSHDDSRRLRYKLLVIRLLTKIRVAPSRSTVREKLQKYSFVRTWADRSETVVALRNASLAWLEFFHGLIGVVYTLFVQPFWMALVDHCRLRRFRAIRWCHGDASTSFPSSNGLHEPLTFEKSTEWSSQSSSRLRSKPFGAAVRSECSKYPRRVMSQFARLGKSVWGLVLESVRCTVVLTKQVILWVKSSKNEKNPFKDFETWSDFYFSQRIITALISSLFLCALLAVFISNVFAWLVAYMYAALGTYEDAVDQVDMRLLWPPGNSRFTSLSHIIYIVFGFLVSQLKEAIGPPSFDQVFQQIVPPAIGGLAFLTWASVAGTWGVMLQNYKVAIMEGRRGKWKFDPDSTNAFNASKYIGYQTVHCLVGFFGIFLFLFVTILALVLLIFVKPLFPAVWRIVESSLFNTNGTLFKIALPLVAQQLLKLLLVNSRNEIRNMILFTFADFLFLIINFIIGALVVIKRSLLIIGGLLLTFWRLDLDWISIDSGHAAYCAMIVIDCRTNNPVVISFCDLIFRDINTRRRMLGKRAHVDEDYLSCPIPCCCLVPCVPLMRCLYPKGGATMCIASDRSVRDDREHVSVLQSPKPLFNTRTTVRNPLAGSPLHSADSSTQIPMQQVTQFRSLSRSFLDDSGSIVQERIARNPILIRYRKRFTSVELKPRVFASRAILYGYVERSVKSFFRQLLEYKRSFAVIRHGYIVFYGSTESRVPSGTIEIAAVVSINTIEDEPNVLELSLAEKAFRIKFSTPGEFKTWESTIRGIWEKPRSATMGSDPEPTPTPPLDVGLPL